MRSFARTRIKVTTDEGIGPCNYTCSPMKSLQEGTGPMNCSHEAFCGASPGTFLKNSNLFVFVGLVAGTKTNFSAHYYNADFVIKQLASLYDRTCPPDLLQGLVPSCVKT